MLILLVALYVSQYEYTVYSIVSHDALVVKFCIQKS